MCIEMFRTRIMLFGTAFVVWLCCSHLFGGADGQVTDPVEVTALHTFKQSLIDRNQNLSNWNHGDPCMSNWTGVLCFNMIMDDGYLHVEELLLQNMNLSGSLSPELHRLSYMKRLNVMWNEISGNIPKEIGNITSLILLLLSGNQLTGSLPEGIGYLPNLDRIQIDQNQISGPIPKSFANLNKTKHLLLDNNNLSGYLPRASHMPKLQIVQLDNNHFDGGATIPATYGNMSHLMKLSLRNCSLQGPIPDMSRMLNLSYIDLSSNQLSGSIPQVKLSENITTIDLSNNNLNGTFPGIFSGLPQLQRLALANNSLSGSIPSNIWENRTSNGTERLIVDLQNNMLSSISGSDNLPPNVTVRLQGNPICLNTNPVQFCGSQNENNSNIQSSTNSTGTCFVQSCPPPYEYAPSSLVPCFCAVPLIVDYRLKSPGFSDFRPYTNLFEEYLTSGLELKAYQLDIATTPMWEIGPRLRMYLKIFPVYIDNTTHSFNGSEVLRIQGLFTRWEIHDSKIFGPYEVLNFILLDPYKDVSKISFNIDGVKGFTYREMALATNNFHASTQVGQGGYGNVYKGILADGTVVAIKRAQEGSLQGEKEFLTEIELLSRLHHRNLVSLIGYCDEEGEQMLVYEFMPNGTLRDQLSGKLKAPMSFAMRLKIALAAAKGILYLHMEANPPIFHRDIKASNILLDSKFTAKVADFGLSRLASIPDIEGTVPAHVSTVVKGTPGYLDPEYFLTRQLTDKSDVYSLGVVFLELLTGMHPISHGKNIVREVNIACRSGIIFSVIDERMGSYPSECVEKFVSLALKCSQEETSARPSMAEVVRELESIRLMMHESDSKVTESFITDPAKFVSPPSSSSSMNHPYVSADVSGSDLVSGVMPSITPR
ncbi:putative LRR receptor-like serine/threonine-protein kinase [Camellia lanceoleosa]|uniref:LRR receptor-like serine/threonine-protein kinase n=1 Tax=Camellia lanceoleosa TaxID=1840588 RepID=A0ACC0HRD9_9ERIC|nr:putative LRR receptor-like serine/threonine-protein kinase [Camellia lanceoleosa]